MHSHISSTATVPPQQQIDVAEDNDEKAHSLQETTSTSTSDPEPSFKPIRPPSSSRRRQSKDTLRSVRSLVRERSNNGYGVDELDPETGVRTTVMSEDMEKGLSGGLGDSVKERGNRQRKTSIADEAGSGSISPGEDALAGRPEEEKDPYEVAWDGGDEDPLNPRSMPTWRKWTIIGITSFGSFCVTNASAVYTASYAQMNAEFRTTRLVATLGLSTFVLGIALGPFWSPLAEFYGRRPIYLCSFVGFLIWIIPSAVSQNIETMIVARFFQGLAGSAFLSVSGGTVGDLFTRDDMLAPMSVFALAPFIGPATGPLIGGLINTYTGWRWTHYFLLILASVMLVSIFLFVPETYHPILLSRKAASLRETTGDSQYYAPIDRTPRSLPHTIATSILRPVQILIFEPMHLVLTVYAAVLLGLLYLFFGAFPLVFTTSYGFNLWQVGLTFMGLLVAMILACLSTPFWKRVRLGLAARRLRETGVLRDEPEDQLPPVIFGAPLITGGLFWFGFTTYPTVHWIVPIIGSGVFGLGTMLAFTGIFTFLVDAYPRYAASALAANALVRCSFAAAFPLFGVQMYEKLGFQWATGLLAFVTLALLPFPYIFFRYGKRIRATSRFATPA